MHGMKVGDSVDEDKAVANVYGLVGGLRTIFRMCRVQSPTNDSNEASP